MQYRNMRCEDELISCILNKYANVDRLKNKNTYRDKGAVSQVFIYNTAQL